MLHRFHRREDRSAVGVEDRDYFVALGEQVPELGADDEGLAGLQLHAEQTGIRSHGGRAFGVRTKEAERHEESLLAAGSPSKDNLWGVFLGLFLLRLEGLRLLFGFGHLFLSQFQEESFAQEFA
jgi:hypothetical protein